MHDANLLRSRQEQRFSLCSFLLTGAGPLVGGQGIASVAGAHEGTWSVGADLGTTTIACEAFVYVWGMRGNKNRE